MKIAFSTSGDNLEAPLDPRFGRAPRFLIYDMEADTFEMVDNGQNRRPRRVRDPVGGGDCAVRSQGSRDRALRPQGLSRTVGGRCRRVQRARPPSPKRSRPIAPVRLPRRSPQTSRDTGAEAA